MDDYVLGRVPYEHHTRRRHKKSRLGCQVCKRRKIKVRSHPRQDLVPPRTLFFFFPSLFLNTTNLSIPSIHLAAADIHCLSADSAMRPSQVAQTVPSMASNVTSCARRRRQGPSTTMACLRRSLQVDRSAVRFRPRCRSMLLVLFRTSDRFI